MRTRHLAAAAIGAATLLAITACSSSSSSDDKADPPTSSTTQAGPAPATTTGQPDTTTLEQAVQTYTADLFSGNPDGYRYLSARCRKQMTKAEWTQLAKGGHQQYGSQKATGIHIDQISGGLARVSYGAGHIPQFERHAQPWAREAGTWRWDACPSTS